MPQNNKRASWGFILSIRYIIKHISANSFTMFTTVYDCLQVITFFCHVRILCRLVHGDDAKEYRAKP